MKAAGPAGRDTNEPRLLVIFDCDGVLVDSEPIMMRVMTQELPALGIHMPYEECVETFVGISRQDALRLLTRMCGHEVPASWLRHFWQAVSNALEREIRPVPGVTNALEKIHALTCVASNGSHEKMKMTLSATGLIPYFEGRIFSASDVPQGKPAPDLFLLAAARLGYAPSCCVVVEDSREGVAAARAAGMRVLGFSGVHSMPSALNDADLSFTAMAELPVLVDQYVPELSC